MAGEGLTKSQSLYFHIQTSAIKRKYITLIVCIFHFFSSLTFNIEMYLYSNILRSQAKCSEVFVRHGTYHVLVRGGSYFCQSPKGGGVRSFLFKREGRANTCFWKKPPNRGQSSGKLLLLKDNPVIDFLPFSTLQPLE